MNKPRQSSDERKAKAAQRAREWYAKPENKARQAAVIKARMERDPEGEKAKNREYSRRWNERNPEKRRVAWIKHKYRLTTEQVEHLLAVRDLCEACMIDKATVIDHDHSSGAFRGQLCQPCNAAAGMLKDSPDRARSMVAYLERFTTETPSPSS